MRRPLPRATYSVVLMSALAAGLISGCSTSGTPSDPEPSGSGKAQARAQASAPASAESLGFTPRRLDLPVYDYQLSPAQYAKVAEAKQALVTACMKRYGFSWSAPTPAIPRQDRRYGVIDLRAAQRYGYHLLPTDTSVAAESGAATPSKEEMAALTAGQLLDGDTGESRLAAGYDSPVKRVRGKAVPPGGCAQEAERKLLGRDDLRSEAGVVSRINTESFSSSMSTPAVKAVFAKWSSCMKKAGYDFPDPLKSIGSADLNVPAAPKAETELATADVKCKESVDLVAVWSRAETSIQRGMIKKKASATAAQRADNATRLRNAAEIVKKSG
ncbi:hypothetical protein [Streptomyces phaeochromogenes]|uniref:hypothetical protein n=2 Tax=Streptomyces phaeochromogenes TaxID=1923 RepID=UPI002DD964EE|nr:hypothetical protein [Streptomyces phaeochromogenes]WRZ31828.1 hypothetical protein OG931_30855 [Streptomyces phaeochromogenes]